MKKKGLTVNGQTGSVDGLEKKVQSHRYQNDSADQWSEVHVWLDRHVIISKWLNLKPIHPLKSIPGWELKVTNNHVCFDSMDSAQSFATSTLVMPNKTETLNVPEQDETTTIVSEEASSNLSSRHIQAYLTSCNIWLMISTISTIQKQSKLDMCSDYVCQAMRYEVPPILEGCARRKNSKIGGFAYNTQKLITQNSKRIIRK